MMEVDFKDFVKTLDKVLRQAVKDDKKIVRDNARAVLLAVVDKTPHRQGHARAGWYPAWAGLGLAGAPKTNQPHGRHTVRNGQSTITYFSEGEFVDNTTDPDDPHIIIKNKVAFLTKAGEVRENFKERRKRGERISKEERARVKGKRSKIAYLFLIERGQLKNDKGQPVSQENKGFFSLTIKKIKFNFGNYYKKNFK